jgi:uncharacterized protein (TIGR00299 family) protein
MRVLYLDCFSGISGDMLVGLFTDLGVAPSAFEWEMNRLNLEEHHLHFERVSRAAISAVHFSVHSGATHRAETHEEAHHHSSDHSAKDQSRDYQAIQRLIGESQLSPFVREKSLAIFRRLAQAESKIHGVPIERIHFHEIGALDSIADIVLTCVGLEALEIDHVYVSPLADGHGVIHCVHGKYPIPAPATLEILKGLPLSQIDVEAELITPTGAAVVAEFQKAVGPMPPLRIERIGYGAGGRDLPGRANVLRGVLGEMAELSGPDDEISTIVEIQANVDDLSPEILGATQEQLLRRGALDVFFTPVQMKKNRPGTLLTVLCDQAKLTEIQTLILRETSTFGVRFREVKRKTLNRQTVTVETEFGPIRVKLGLFGTEIVQVSPEFEDCRAISLEQGKPLKRIYEAAVATYWAKH